MNNAFFLIFFQVPNKKISILFYLLFCQEKSTETLEFGMTYDYYGMVCHAE